MGLGIEYIDGQTPLSEEDKEGLLIKSITTREELNEFEQLNIQKAVEWSLYVSFSQEEILTEAFVKRLHKMMFKDVWKWAGSFRKSNTNLGVDWQAISIELKNLLDDCKYWIENNTYDHDELVIRFKHKIVSIHCFPNGNGRHSRLIADILIEHVFDTPVFSWGGNKDLVTKGKVRQQYIDAIRSADKGEMKSLILFARS